MPKFEPAFIDEIKSRVRLVELVGKRVKLTKKGREHSGLCPFHSEKTPSFTVNEDKGFYHCFGCGAHGGSFDWIMNTEGWSFLEAVEQLADLAGMQLPEDVSRTTERNQKARKELAPVVDRASDEEYELERAEKINRARQSFASCVAADETLVDIYLKFRGIDLSNMGGIPASIRFHSNLYHADSDSYFPAMVSAVQDGSRKITGIHRTYLAVDGKGKAPVKKSKKMSGVCWGGAIRLCPAAPKMGIAEGIETSLSVMVATGLPVWAAASMGNMAAVELPDIVREIVLCVDGDSDLVAMEKVMEKAKDFHALRGRKVSIARPPEGMDFNDLLQVGHD